MVLSYVLVPAILLVVLLIVPAVAYRLELRVPIDAPPPKKIGRGERIAVVAAAVAGAGLLAAGGAWLGVELTRTSRHLVGAACFGTTGWFLGLAVVGGVGFRMTGAVRSGQALLRGWGVAVVPLLVCGLVMLVAGWIGEWFGKERLIGAIALIASAVVVSMVFGVLALAAPKPPAG